MLTFIGCGNDRIYKCVSTSVAKATGFWSYCTTYSHFQQVLSLCALNDLLRFSFKLSHNYPSIKRVYSYRRKPEAILSRIEKAPANLTDAFHCILFVCPAISISIGPIGVPFFSGSAKIAARISVCLCSFFLYCEIFVSNIISRSQNGHFIYIPP